MSYRKLLAREPKTNEEVDELIKVIQSNPRCEPPIGEECYCVSCSAREEIILSQVRKMWSVCKKYSLRSAKTEELMADAIIATQELLDDFISGDKSGCFGHYLWSVLRDAIRPSDIRNRNVDPTERTKRLSYSVYAYKRDFELKYGRNPSPREIALEIMTAKMSDHTKYTNVELVRKHLDTLEKNIILIFELNQWPIELDDIAYRDEDSTSKHDIIGTEDCLRIDLEQQDQIEAAFSTLNETEKLILGHTYGIWIGSLHYDKLTPNEIIEKLGKNIGHSALQERRKNIINKLRANKSLWTDGQNAKISNIKRRKKPEGTPDKPKNDAWNYNKAIVAYHESGYTLNRIAEIYHVSSSTIGNILRDEGYNPRKYTRPKSKAWKHSADIKESYLSGVSVSKLAKKYKCSVATIQAVLKSENIKLNGNGAPKRGAWRYAEDIKQHYLGGKSLKQIADEYNCSYNTIRTIVKDQGIKPRKAGKGRSEVRKDAELIKQYYLDGNSVISISREYKCSEALIKAILVEEGVYKTRKKKK